MLNNWLDGMALEKAVRAHTQFMEYCKAKRLKEVIYYAISHWKWTAKEQEQSY